MVMFATSEVELTKRVELVRTRESLLPSRSQSAFDPTSNPDPEIWTSKVVSDRACAGDAAVTAILVALFPNCAPGGAPRGPLVGSEHPATSKTRAAHQAESRKRPD